ncbi:MAG TPA: A/G-specific adenine glycosylase [Kiritimatiellia bacterium]|nr:A/G-specific adenine glycosylase [Kiritimatiellia bacterium]
MSEALNNRREASVKRRVASHLLPWFESVRRDLPWRRNRTAYRVWISELMLQQTRVDTVIPYFQRFMARFPTVAALAAAPRDEVMKAWEGLGYYRRVIRAHEMAKHIVDERKGRFPRSRDEWLKLDGVGPYTAAAVASLAFGEDVAVVDGNVIRVLSRWFGIDEPVGKAKTRRRFDELAHALLPRGSSAAYNEAMMELGATVCTPRNPACGSCPMRPVCFAAKTGQPESFPVVAPASALPHKHVGAGVIVDQRGRILIARRNEKAMLGGLWEFPGGGVEEGETLPQCIARELAEELGLSVRVGPHLITVRHTFSHFRMDLHAYWVRIDSGRPKAIGCAGFAWVTPDTISTYALPRADQKILEALQGNWPPPGF